jgi:hypothetical protein
MFEVVIEKFIILSLILSASLRLRASAFKLLICLNYRLASHPAGEADPAHPVKLSIQSKGENMLKKKLQHQPKVVKNPEEALSIERMAQNIRQGTKNAIQNTTSENVTKKTK